MLHKIGKKLTVALATFALAMGTLLYAVPAFAAASDGSIAVTGNGPFASISVYQMFSQNDSNSYVLNDKWEDFFTTDAGSGGIGLTADDADLSNAAYTYIRGLGNDDAEGMAAFAKQAAAWAAAHSIQATATPSATANADGTSKTATASSLAYGYYLVVPSPEGSTDQTDPSRGTDALLVNVNSATPVAIDLKTVYPTIQKVVNGSDKHASASVGESLPFTLTSMVPDVSGYTNGYQFAIQDTLSEGLTLDKASVKVEIGGTDVTSSCVITYRQDVGNTFVINFGTEDTALGAGEYDASNLFTGKAGETITVTYTAMLNTSASLAGTGKDNTNSAKVIYSNGPALGDLYASAEVFTHQYTFNFDLEKTDGTNPLAGATFQLKDAKGNVISLVATGSSNTYRPAMGDETASAVTEVTTPTDGVIHFVDLAEGSYTLTETKAPEGYNKAADTTVTIAAEYNTDGTLQSWSVNNNGQNPVEIVNNAGILLPGTGGVGTVVFTVVGVVAIVGGTAWMMTRRARRNS